MKREKEILRKQLELLAERSENATEVELPKISAAICSVFDTMNGVTRCKCCELCKAKEILDGFTWNPRKGLSRISYDRGSDEIVIDEGFLMRCTQLANPLQKERKIRLGRL